MDKYRYILIGNISYGNGETVLDIVLICNKSHGEKA